MRTCYILLLLDDVTHETAARLLLDCSSMYTVSIYFYYSRTNLQCHVTCVMLSTVKLNAIKLLLPIILIVSIIQYFCQYYTVFLSKGRNFVKVVRLAYHFRAFNLLFCTAEQNFDNYTVCSIEYMMHYIRNLAWACQLAK